MAAGALLVVASVGMLVTGGGTQAAGTATFALSPASQTIPAGSGSVKVDVMLNDAAGVSSWEFRLSYNPSVLDLVKATPDQSFMSSLPGQLCPGALSDETAGWVTVGCVTSGQYDGASGSGRVATIEFAPKSSGKSNLIFTKADISNWEADSLGVTVGTGLIKVSGAGESTDVEATPTVNPAGLTATPPSGATAPTPIDPNDPNVPAGSTAATATPRSGVAGSGGGSTSGSGGTLSGSHASTGSGSGSGSTGAQGSDNFPVAGYGTLEERRPVWPRYLYGFIAIVGVALVIAGARSTRERPV
jgi:hypothetical protein